MHWKTLSLLILIPLVLVFVGCRLVTNHLVEASDRGARRNPETGVLVGAEDFTLGPDDSSGAVLFVHGFIGAANNFNELPRRVADLGWRVRVMRLPGHGTSPLDYEKTTPDELIEAVRAELAALDSRYSTVAVVAHSMGGALSAIAISELGADKLVLGAPYFGITSKWWYGFDVETWNAIGSPFVRWVYKPRSFLMVNQKESREDIVCYRWIPTKGAQTLIEIARRANDPGILQKVSCPILLFHSHDDLAASCECAEAAVNQMGSAEKRTVWVDRSNHHIFWDYDAELICEETLKFLGPVPL